MWRGEGFVVLRARREEPLLIPEKELGENFIDTRLDPPLCLFRGHCGVKGGSSPYLCHNSGAFCRYQKKRNPLRKRT